MKSEIFICLFLLTISTFTTISCSGEIHRDGTVLYYKASNDKLFLLYQNNGQNHLLAANLEPLKTSWEKEIAGDSESPEIKIFDDYIAANCKDGKVCLISIDNGKIVNSFDSKLVFRPESRGFTVSNGFIYTLCNSSEICEYKIGSDEPEWTYKLADGENITVEFQEENGLLLFGNSDNIIKALSTSNGELKWSGEKLNDLSGIYLFPETVLANYESVNGFSLQDGESKWLTPYKGKVRCILDGIVITQSEDYFSTLYIENGQKIWEYPINGTTILTCEENLSIAAFTVKDYGKTENTGTGYFDKIYFFNANLGEKVFEINSDSEHTVINLAGLNETYFYIAEMDNTEKGTITVEQYSSVSFEMEKSFRFTVPDPKDNIYISWIHSDLLFTVLKRSNIDDDADKTYYLFANDSAQFLGELESVPEVMTATKAYDIISYDNYFNVVEKNLDEFLK